MNPPYDVAALLWQNPATTIGTLENCLLKLTSRVTTVSDATLPTDTVPQDTDSRPTGEPIGRGGGEEHGVALLLLLAVQAHIVGHVVLV